MKIAPQRSNELVQHPNSLLYEKDNLLKRKKSFTISSSYRDVWQRVRIKVFVLNIFLKIVQQRKFDIKRNTFINLNTNELVRQDTIGKGSELDFPKYMIHPDSRFKSFWGVYVGILLIYTALIMPFVLAFVNTGEYDVWFFLDVILDLSFFTDIIINLFSAYYKSDGGLEIRRKLIFLTYLKSWLVIDFLSCVPFGLLDNSAAQENNSGYQNDYKNILKLLRLPKLYRVFRIFKLLKMVNYKGGRLMEQIQDFLSLKHSGIRLMSSCLTIIISIHIMSCFWYYGAKIEGLSPETWVFRLNLIDADTVTLYISSLYWAMTTFCTVGYGDLNAKTPLEMIMCIFWMLFSVYYLSFVIGSLTNMLENVYVKSNFLRNKLAIMDDFAKEARIDQVMLNKIRRALKYSNKKTCLSIKERDAILCELPTPLKYEIAVAMHGQACSKIDFFRDKDKVIILGIVPYLHPVYVDQNDFVYTKGEHVDGIYFIIKGYTAYVLTKCDTVIKGIQCGECFGDIEATQHTTRKYSVKALRNTDLLSMDTYILQQFAINYLDEWEKLRKEALEKDYSLIKTIAEIKETGKLETVSDLRKFKISVESRILKKKITALERTFKLARQDINLTNLNRKMENMLTRLFNLDSNIKTIKKEIALPRTRRNSLSSTRGKTFHETQDSLPDENSPSGVNGKKC